MAKTIHYFIKGRVQGVWFRASTQKTAQSLGLSGWVRNTPDGKVEAIASGDEDSLKAFSAWLRQGPMLAKVDNVVIEALETQTFSTFEIR